MLSHSPSSFRLSSPSHCARPEAAKGGAATVGHLGPAQRRVEGTGDGKRRCGARQPPAKHAPTYPPAARAGGKLLVQLGNARVFCHAKGPAQHPNSRGRRGCLSLPRDRFNWVFVTWECAVTFLCPTGVHHVCILAAPVVVPAVPAVVMPYREGTAGYAPPSAAGAAGSRGISSRAVGQSRPRCPSAICSTGGRCPPASQLSPGRTFPAWGLGCVFQISPRSLQILPAGSCRT